MLTYSSSSIEYFQHTLCPIYFNLLNNKKTIHYCEIPSSHSTTYLSVRVFNCRVVLFNKDPLYKLYSLILNKTYFTMATTHTHMNRTSALLPTPPDPRTTSLYSRILDTYSKLAQKVVYTYIHIISLKGKPSRHSSY